MSTPKISFRAAGSGEAAADESSSHAGFDSLAGISPPPTHAVFSPSSSYSQAARASKRRSTILVHQKSPLLLATPPQITRALAYSHPFLLPLNRLVGLLTWTTADVWESFLIVAAFWAVVLYGDLLVRLAAPILAVAGLILGMYGRRFSPLSSSGWTEPAGKESGGGGGQATGGTGSGSPDAKRAEKSAGLGAGTGSKTGSGHQRAQSAEVTNTRHQKTLDEIVETLRELTARCNILLEPLLELTDFLSTQRTPTSATTRPALVTLFIRILLCTPFWIALTLPPLRIITTRRVALVVGTVILTWHARAMRVAREILWRSATIRRASALITGLTFEGPMRPASTDPAPPGSARAQTSVPKSDSHPTGGRKKLLTHHHTIGTGKDAGVRFTFIIYENQRRWVVLGWTANLLGYERAAWTDEHNNAVPAKDEFELPEVDGGSSRWRWVAGSRWRVDGVPIEDAGGGGDGAVDYDGEAGKLGWIYYDNKWLNGRRGVDGWGKWTRRRKWYRDAELVEVDEQHEQQEEDREEQQQHETQPQPPPHPPPPQPPPHQQHLHQHQNQNQNLHQHQHRQHEETYPPPLHDFEATPSSPTWSKHSVEIRSEPDDRPATSSAAFASLQDLAERDAAARADREREKADDSSSVLSTSSRLFRNSLRRRTTDRSSSRRAPSSESISRGSRTGAGIDGEGGAASVREVDEGVADDSGLGIEAEMELQGQGREVSKWGIGDEARMGFE